MSWFGGLKDGWKIAERTQEILLLSIYLPDIERRLRKEEARLFRGIQQK